MSVKLRQGVQYRRGWRAARPWWLRHGYSIKTRVVFTIRYFISPFAVINIHTFQKLQLVHFNIVDLMLLLFQIKGGLIFGPAQEVVKLRIVDFGAEEGARGENLGLNQSWCEQGRTQTWFLRRFDLKVWFSFDLKDWFVKLICYNKWHLNQSWCEQGRTQTNSLSERIWSTGPNSCARSGASVQANSWVSSCCRWGEICTGFVDLQWLIKYCEHLLTACEQVYLGVVHIC